MIIRRFIAEMVVTLTEGGWPRRALEAALRRTVQYVEPKAVFLQNSDLQAHWM